MSCRPLKDDEIAKVLECLTTSRDKALFILGCRTGFRISELLSIDVQDVYQQEHMVSHLRIQRSYMKEGVTRTVALHPQSRAILLTYIEQTGLAQGSPLFPSRNGHLEPIKRSRAHKILKAAYAKAKLTGPGLATHTMRKTLAANIYKKLGHDLLATQKALGHSALVNTIRYLPDVDKEKLETAFIT